MSLAERFWSKVDASKHYNGCAEWNAAMDSNGYGAFMYNKKKWNTHRFVMMILRGEKAIAGKDVMHSCDNRKCVNPFHLSIGTRKENLQDAFKKGRLDKNLKNLQKHQAKGSQRGNAKLTEEKVREIRKRYAEGERVVNLAKEFNIGREHVYHIIRGKRWAWVK